MSAQLVITGMSSVEDAGFGGFDGLHAWPEGSTNNPKAWRWRLFSEEPFDRFRRLDALSKRAMAATELLGIAPPPEGTKWTDIGVVLATREGCRETDIAFIESMKLPGGGSPKLFSYTLPSTAIGEVAIRNKLCGPNLCVLPIGDTGAVALWEGVHGILSGEMRSCVCLGCDGLCDAHVFLVESADAARERGHVARAELNVVSSAFKLPEADMLASARLCGYLRGDTAGGTPFVMPHPLSLGDDVIEVTRLDAT